MFERLSVMIVEDSPFMSRMLDDVLRALEIGRIQIVRDGGQAVSMLRSITKNEQAAGLLAFDLIFSDYIMSPINGAMLLRWIRQSPESPDRFVPVIMMSAAADTDKVRECRDLGATEFVGKPFSIASVANHLVELVEHPRPFIHTHDYFGPDRRRQQRYLDQDRRIATAADIQTIYSGKKAKLENSQAKVFHYILPNRLRDKVAGLNRGPIVIDPAVMKSAESQLDRLEADYAEWVKESIVQLKVGWARARAGEDKKRAHAISVINRVALDLRGQGTTFGYPLITEFSKSLYESTCNVEVPDDQLLELIKDHVNAITAVIRDRVKGMGGEVGQAIVQGLEEARDKRAHKPLAIAS